MPKFQNLGRYNSPQLTGISSSKFTQRAPDVSTSYPIQAPTWLPQTCYIAIAP